MPAFLLFEETGPIFNRIISTMNNLIKDTVRNWWLFLLSGILFLSCGIGIFFVSISSYLTLLFLLQLVFFPTGLFEITYALSNKSVLKNWGVILAGGVLILILSFFLHISSSLSMTISPIYLGLIFLLRAVIGISCAANMQLWNLKGWDWTMVIAIIGVYFSLAIIWKAASGELSIIKPMALALIVCGLFQIIFSNGVKKLNT